MTPTPSSRATMKRVLVHQCHQQWSEICNPKWLPVRAIALSGFVHHI